MHPLATAEGCRGGAQQERSWMCCHARLRPAGISLCTRLHFWSETGSTVNVVTLIHWTVVKPTTGFDWSYTAVSERLCSQADLSTYVNFVGQSLKTNPWRFKSLRCHFSKICLTCMFLPFLLNMNHLQHFRPLLGNTKHWFLKPVGLIFWMKWF